MSEFLFLVYCVLFLFDWGDKICSFYVFEYLSWYVWVYLVVFVD